MRDEWGITDGFYDVDGEWHPTSESTRDTLRASMGVPVEGPPMWFVPAGVAQQLWSPCTILLEDGSGLGPVDQLPHDLPIGHHDLVPVDGGATTRLVVHPERCPEVPRAWGIAAQVYALWSDTSWGIGDLDDVAQLVERVAADGGGAVLLSPLHQPAPSLPQEPSPYYPSSRRSLNPLLLGMRLPVPAALQIIPDALIDRDAVWVLKRAELEREFAARPEGDADDTVEPDAIAWWNARCDEHGSDWTTWPANDRSDHETRTRAMFHQWVQERIGAQLGEVNALGRKLDVRVIGDLAVGFAPNGADAHEFRDLLALDARIGAPPDTFNTDGQEWGIPPLTPWRLRAAWYEPFIDTVRANLRHVDGLRIDHVMGLFRQFWVPLGSTPADGAYVEFPAEELLAIICLEATRAGAFVIGEDLGTVEPSVRSMLAERGIVGTRVLWFEPDPPTEWPEHCLATVTTHDLPTIAGVVGGTDGDETMLERIEDVSDANDVVRVVEEVHRALLDSPARLRLIAADDLAGTPNRPNLPGMNDYPSWRRHLPFPVDELL